MKYFFLISIIFLILVNEANAQSYSACFTSNKTIGCFPLAINLTDCSGIPSSEPRPLYIIYGPGYSDTTFQATINLPNPGFYSIIQIVSNGDAPGATDSLKRTDYIEVLPKPEPDFTVSICIGGAVIVNITDTIYDKYYIDFGDGSAVVNALPNDNITHTYSNVADKTITVTGHHDPIDCGNQRSVQIRPFLNLPVPEIENIIIGNSSSTAGDLSITFLTDNHHKYKIIQETPAGTIELDSILYISGIQTKVISPINTETESHCFIIQSYDDCGNSILSKKICSVPLSVTPSDKIMNLSWVTSTTFDSYSIRKNGDIIATVASNAVNFTDNDIICGVNYCYQVIGTKDGSMSTSSEICKVGQSSQSPNPIANINSIHNDGQVNISWQEVAEIAHYTIYKSGRTGSIQIGTTTTPSYSISDNSEIECYAVTVTDKCGNSSPLSTATCPVHLTLSRGTSENALSWTPYSGTANNITYWVEKLDKNLNIIESIPVGSEVVFSEKINPSNPVYYYKVKITGDNNFVSYSNLVELSNTMVLLIPTAFSPNNDGVNDEFKPEGKFILNYRLTIINNWGNVVFTTTNLEEGWDGTLNGRPLVSGAYAYLIEATDYEGNKEPKSGTVTLIR